MPRRIAIIGNAGTGKSFLAARLSNLFGIPSCALDDLFWADKSYTAKRSEDLVVEKLEEFTRGEEWIVEGVYGELVERLTTRASILIWIDLDWRQCKDALVQRQSKRERNSENFDVLLEYAEQYWSRDNKRSHWAHGKLLAEFEGESHRLTSRRMTDELFLENA
jgi:adenylate kinase family enzyme